MVSHLRLRVCVVGDVQNARHECSALRIPQRRLDSPRLHDGDGIVHDTAQTFQQCQVELKRRSRVHQGTRNRENRGEQTTTVCGRVWFGGEIFKGDENCLNRQILGFHIG
eukprot:Gregarina_sp_Pseudo_9__3933@NODE_407_length_2902_cov_4_373385_g384_i0_p7_GENE_NODE_407_length_2902_cov_4_373385_g384_i0NODE_407_length_2902_cov_4_373385_g384_i0_p7_ORF_typecomplete_len110_score5_97RNF220/PF15926_5/0_0097_NODE_407_length_2902_cov_4_373385_g384_i023712700